MEEPSLLSSATTHRPSPDISESTTSRPQPRRFSSLISRFKGVVGQANGHWGAQIYCNHNRIWLGTFKSEREAAEAYDSAATKLRRKSHSGLLISNRNFPLTEMTLREPSFQDQFSTEAVLTMIKDGSYPARFTEYLRTNQDLLSRQLAASRRQRGGKLRRMFDKELTPSDVGKLNRLVIPKKHAVKYFPRINLITDDDGDVTAEDMELVFFDRWMRSWKFRYCYWKSSQSFVFTRGWNGFAKEKALGAKDKVVFSSYECGNGDEKLCVIDVEYDGGARLGMDLLVRHGMDERENGYGDVEIKENVRNFPVDNNERGEEEKNGYDRRMKGNAAGSSGNHHAPNKGLKLFGVQIV